MMFNRRNFIKFGVGASLLAETKFSAFADGVSQSKKNSGYLQEPGKDIKVVRETDVIVCGGGFCNQLSLWE